MNKSLRIISSFCALVMSTSIVVPAYAVPSKSCNNQSSNNQNCNNAAIDIVKNRLQIFENRLNEYAFNSNDLNLIKSNFSKIKNHFNSSEAELLACSSEDFNTKLLEFHTDIDEINNALDEEYILNFNVENNKINAKLFNIVNSDIESRKNNIKDFHKKAELRQFKARLCQLRCRLDYCLFHLKNVKNRLSSDMLNSLNTKFDNINGMLNSTLEDLHFNATKLDDLTTYHQEINKLHSLIDNLEQDLETISNSSDEQLQKQDIMKKLSSLTLYNVNKTAKQMKELGKKAGYNGWDHQIESLDADLDEFKSECIDKYLKGYKHGKRKLKRDRFNTRYRRNIRKYIRPEEIIREVPEPCSIQ